jgi:RND family efflux transporter MFP subunit
MKPFHQSMGMWLLMAGAVFCTSCGDKSADKEPVIAVQAVNAQRGPIEQVIRAEAVIFPRNQAAITPKVVAPIREFLVNRGSRVHKGQLLAVLENRDLSASVRENQGNLDQAEAAYKTTMASGLPEELRKAELDAKSAHEALAAAQKVYDSRQQLFSEGALPRRDLDQASVALVQAKAQSELADKHLVAMQSVGNAAGKKSAAGQLASAHGKYEGASAQLSYSEIRSPMDGVVTDRPLYVGETPAPGTPLLTVMDMSSVTARTHIPQEQAAMLRVGDPARISAPAGVEVQGKVKLVSPALDANSTTVEVWVEASNKDGRLRPGTTVSLEMGARTIKDAIVVPAAAVFKTPEGVSTVMTVGSDGRAHQVEVEIGIRQGDRVQIAKGLEGSEKVITVGGYGLPDKTRVKASETTASDGASEKSGAASSKDESKD